MKDIKLNYFDKNQRRLLQYGVILILVLFLGAYFLLQQKDNLLGNNEIYLENSTLRIFDDTYTFNGYPDRILVHNPYFILVQGNKPLTIIYNLETKQKEKEINDILLDYYDGNIVYNRKETFFNDKNLGEFCDAAFIKTSTEILCISKQSQNYVANMLLSINPETPNLWKRIYHSNNILTTVSIINNNLYIGEINFETKQSYLTVNEQTMPVENIVSVIYEVKGQPRFTSFKSALNNNTLSSYLIESDQIIKNSEEKIVFFNR